MSIMVLQLNNDHVSAIIILYGLYPESHYYRTRTEDAIKVSNLPTFLREEQLKEVFNAISSNSVKDVHIPFDIADYPLDYGYVSFDNIEETNC
ncbi:unnamed protein product [Rotaria magnacalcarata]|uniref:RRM domain-containing protein n=1 Tax=Rotaria magnacalcarata TaxID=392030 RepID=A0A8S2NJU5_9BILA|nr:unnamed protein product [Rotaria magnacalcarata]